MKYKLIKKGPNKGLYESPDGELYTERVVRIREPKAFKKKKPK